MAVPFFQKPGGVFLLCVLLYGLTLWTFFPALHCSFLLFDDVPILVHNPHVNTGLSWQNVRWALFSTSYSFSYPLDQVSHMLDYTLFGAKPWGHHLTNVLIHSANGVLLFIVFRRMTGALWRSLIVALLFAVHPLRVESVAWVSERKDVLCTFFGLLALWMYVRRAEESRIQGGRTKRFYALSLLFFALALMSKSMVVTLPCAMLLLDYWPLRRFPDFRFSISVFWRLLLEKIPFFALVMLEGIATWIASKANGATFILHLPWPMRLETAVISYERYIGLMFWPAKLSAIYPYPDHWPTSQLLFATALFVVMSALAWIWRRQRPYWTVGWLWYVGILLPACGLIPLGGESICTRFTYIPMMGALLLFVWGVDDFSKRWRQRGAAIAGVVILATVLCVIRTRAEIGYWKNGETLYRRAIVVTTNNFMAHYCLGTVLAHHHDPAGELAEYQKSVDIYPDYPNAQQELGVIQLHYGRYVEAATHFRKAIQLDPQNGWAYHNLGVSLLKTGRANEAVPLFLKAAEIDPLNTADEDALNAILYPAGHEGHLITNFLAAVRADPAGFERFLGTLQGGTNYVALMNNLAFSFAVNPDPTLRNGKYAVRLATRACEMTGFRSNHLLMTLAVADAEVGRYGEAVTNAQHACALTTTPSEAGLLKEYQAFVTLFRSHHPYHEPAK